MYRDLPWTHRFSSWRSGEWEDLEDHDIEDWMLYAQSSDGRYRLRRVSPSWIILDYRGGAFPEHNYAVFFHHRRF